MKIGDVVILNSGGPLMTVIETPKPGFIKTCWIHDGVAHSLSLSDYAVIAAEGMELTITERKQLLDDRARLKEAIRKLLPSSTAGTSNPNEDKQC